MVLVAAAAARGRIAAVLGFCGTLAGAFPLTNLTVGKDLFEKLKEPNTGGVTSQVQNAILDNLRAYFAKAENSITVERDDVLVTKHYPDKLVDGSCGHSVTVLHPAAVGRLLDGSSLNAKAMTSESWPGVAIFADADIDATLDVNGAVRVNSGMKIFHKCRHLARKTVGLNILSGGTASIGLNMTASNIQVNYLDGQCTVAFDFHAQAVGTIRSWKIEQVVANNCKIRILGIAIGSVCGAVEERVRVEAEQYINKYRLIEAPKLLKRLETKINTAIGSRVTLNVTMGGMLSNLWT